MKPEDIPLALTYDDVLLRPQFSRVRSRRDVETGTQFTRQIALTVPLVSANMDTVTEARMAIAMARFGGIGVIHRFMSVEDQVGEVVRVKRRQSYVIADPVTVGPRATAGEARGVMARHDISGMPVVDKSGRLLGMLTTRDVALADDSFLVSERMTPRERLITAGRDVGPETARRMLSDHRLEKLPLVDDDDRVVGLITARDIVAASVPETAGATLDGQGRLRVAAAVGVVGDFAERGRALADAGVDAIVVDVAHGDSQLMLNAVGALREQFGELPVIAGNVATADGARRMADAGVDAIKVGVGPGSVCITRRVAGVGVPQLTAVLECGAVGRKYGIPIIADGGIRYAGDVAKAIAGGASSVMLGSVLAGADESPGAVISRDGRKMKMVRGMASREAALYRSLRENPTPTPDGWESQDEGAPDEGVQAPVPYRGPVTETLREMVGGLRSGMSYCDAPDIATIWKNAQFVRQTAAGRVESGPHDVG